MALGDISITSYAYMYLMQGLTKEYINTNLMCFGSLEGREITFPEYSLLLHERQGYAKKPEEAKGEFFRITMPKGFNGIEDVAADADAPCVYYTLQGLKLTSTPTAAGIYIRMRGSNTEKIYIK